MGALCALAMVKAISSIDQVPYPITFGVHVRFTYRIL